ncbi:hypothetical protein ACHAQA_005128 [Verticillium albo-atrum]
MSREFHHPAIGNIHGQQDDQVLYFRGIKYATLGHWLDDAILPQYDGSGLVALSYGSQAPANPAALDVEFAALQQRLPAPDVPVMSATECLNLNLAVPVVSTPTSKLPVLVFIHGGGFNGGANWWPQYDVRRLVALSVENGKPVIALNINYRLGAAGFLTSQSLREQGYSANRGLRDQRIALRWVQEHIAGFGGDPANVTAAGESVGGLSCARLLYGEEQVAARIIVMGGAPPSLQPLDPAVADVACSLALEALGAADSSPDKQAGALIKATASDVGHGFKSPIPFVPVLDEATLPLTESFALMASDDSPFRKSTSTEALVVYSPLDASIYAVMGLFEAHTDLVAAFSASMLSVLQQHQAQVADILRIYNITPSLDRQTALIRILEFASDLTFQLPARALALNFAGRSFLLQFSEPNPWPGKFQGHSTHILDAAFLFQNYNDLLSPTQQAAAQQLADDVLDFMNGQVKWPAFNQAGVAILQGGERRYVEEPNDAGSARFAELRGIAQVVGQDVLLGAWTAFAFAQRG